MIDGNEVAYCGTIDDGGKAHGCGRFILQNGGIYLGQFKHGDMHGFVRYINSDSYVDWQFEEGSGVSYKKYNLKGKLTSQW